MVQMSRAGTDRDATDVGAAVRRMLEPRSIAVVGASDRPGSFGRRMTGEVLRSAGADKVHLVHPKYDAVRGIPCVPSLADVPEPVDLVLLGVPDAALVEQVKIAAGRGDGGAVIFGSAPGIGPDIAAAAASGSMALCGAGCMGFVNVSRGVRAIGYVERAELAPGPVALITHSGSVFSAMLRTHRRLDYSIAISAGQELVTTAADYLRYAVDLDETRVVGLFIETLRDADGLRAGLARALERDIPVVALTVGGSPTGRQMVTAHSGALAGDDAAWEALFAAYGVHRVFDLDELVDSLELFAIGRRATIVGPGTGVATLHDSGGERALMADVAHAVGLSFAELGPATQSTLAGVLAEGLEPTNPLDLWGTGAGTEDLFTTCMTALAEDPHVSAIALAIDLAEEYDGDEAYPTSMETLLRRTDKPLAVLSHVANAVDSDAAARLRAIGVPVLEGTVSGSRALRHLLDQATPPSVPTGGEVDADRAARWRARLREGPLTADDVARLMSDYGISFAEQRVAADRAEAVAAADDLGYPAVVKTDMPGVDHKADVGGVHVGLRDAGAVGDAYDDIASRLGSRVVVQAMAPGNVELALGIVRDPLVGPMVLLAVGGTLVEVIGRRVVALAPVSRERAEQLIEGFDVVSTLLGGVRGNPASDTTAVVDALVALGQVAVELGDVIEALDVNPLICGPSGAVAVDALVQARADAPR
jgi:acetate---CoA ligase (ADP-forming)